MCYSCVSLLFLFIIYYFEFQLIFVIRGPLNLCICGPCLNCQITWLSCRRASRGVTPVVLIVPGCLTPAAYVIFSAGRVHHDELRYQQPLWRNLSSSPEPLTHLWIKCNKTDYGETSEDINAQTRSFSEESKCCGSSFQHIRLLQATSSSEPETKALLAFPNLVLCSLCSINFPFSPSFLSNSRFHLKRAKFTASP